MGWWRKKKGWWRKKKKPLNEIESKRGADLLEDLIQCCDGKSNPIKFFSADEIRKATDNFSESNHICQLSDSEYKWYSVSSMVRGHKNSLKLIGCCLEFEDSVIVYHGVKKHYKLDDLSEEPWKRRMKIAEDIATALAYLHSAFPRPFVHRNMDLWNIILDEDGVAKLNGFSFCVLIPEGETSVKVDRIVGAVGYLDEKYGRAGIVSEKTDVFAIGNIMRNLLVGLHVEEEEEEGGDGEGGDYVETNDYVTITKINYPKRKFQSTVSRLIEEGRMDEIADPEMVEKMDEISEQELCQMKAFGMLSLRCMGHKGEEVPKMVEVVKELKKIQRSLRNDSSSPSGETPFDSAQDISSSVALSNKS